MADKCGKEKENLYLCVKGVLFGPNLCPQAAYIVVFQGSLKVLLYDMVREMS